MRVIVCGAGIAGLTLANRLATLGNDVVLLERATGLRSQGYMIDFFGPGYETANAMGLLPAVKDVAYHIVEAILVDDRGRRRAGIRPETIARGPLLDVMRPDLEKVLFDHLPHQVDVRMSTSPVQVLDGAERVSVTLDDGGELEADLLVGADGIHSTVRSLVFGAEPAFFRHLGYHSAAFVFDAPDIHDAVRDRAFLTDTVERQLGLYGLRDGRVAAFAVHRTQSAAMPADRRAAVREAYRGMGWVVAELLERLPPSDEIYYDQVGQIVMPTWSRGRVTLVGDAAYAVSLVAAQGASLAMAGAYVLADELSRSESVGEALRRYEQRWRPVAEERQAAGRSAARWFLPSNELQVRIRHVVLAAARLPGLNRWIAAAVGGKPAAIVAQSTGQAPVTHVGPLLRMLFRAPARLYEHGLGWILGRRFVCLTHVGRRSGRRYRTVLEVIGIDGDEVMVIAGLGPTSDWFRNLQAGSGAEITLGRNAFAADSRVLEPAEAEGVIADYERRNRWVRPIVRRVLTSLLGWRYDGSPDARERLVRERPIVAFRRRPAA